MKKFIYSAFFCFALASTCFINTGCGDGCDEDDVAKKAEAYVEAAFNYSFDQSSENCQIYKNALNAYLDSVDGCDEVSESDKEEARTALNEIGC